MSVFETQWKPEKWARRFRFVVIRQEKRQDFSHWNANEKSLLDGALRRGRRSVEVEFGMEAGLRLMGAMLRLA
jgi:hypothetical protein